MANSHKKSRYPRTGIRSKAFVYRGTTSKQTPSSSQNEYGAVCSDRQRNRHHVEERCYSKSQVSERPVSKQSFPCRKERRGKQTGYKFKESECLLTLPTFQNGGSPSPKGNAPGERLFVQGGFVRCIFQHSTPSDSKKICAAAMEGQHLPISLPLLWPRFSSEAVYQTTKNTSCPGASFECSHDNIFRRYAVDVSVRGENAYSKRHSALSTAAFGFGDKSDQITIDPSGENGIFGDGDQLLRYDSESSVTKSQQSYKTVSGGTGEPENNSVETFQSNRHTLFKAQAVLPAQLQLRYLQQQLIESLRLNQTHQSYIILNQTSLQEIEWWISNLHLTNGKSVVLPTAKIVIQTDASKKGWGVHCLGQSVGGGTMDFSGIQSTHHFIRSKGSTSCSFYFFKNQGFVCSIFANGQYDSPVISSQNGWYPQQGINIHSEGNMGLPAQETDHNNCRVSARGLECTGRHSFSTFP